MGETDFVGSLKPRRDDPPHAIIARDKPMVTLERVRPNSVSVTKEDQEKFKNDCSNCYSKDHTFMACPEIKELFAKLGVRDEELDIIESVTRAKISQNMNLPHNSCEDDLPQVNCEFETIYDASNLQPHKIRPGQLLSYSQNSSFECQGQPEDVTASEQSQQLKYFNYARNWEAKLFRTIPDPASMWISVLALNGTKMKASFHTGSSESMISKSAAINLGYQWSSYNADFKYWNHFQYAFDVGGNLIEGSFKIIEDDILVGFDVVLGFDYILKHNILNIDWGKQLICFGNASVPFFIGTDLTPESNPDKPLATLISHVKFSEENLSDEYSDHVTNHSTSLDPCNLESVYTEIPPITPKTLTVEFEEEDTKQNELDPEVELKLVIEDPFISPEPFIQFSTECPSDAGIFTTNQVTSAVDFKRYGLYSNTTKIKVPDPGKLLTWLYLRGTTSPNRDTKEHVDR